jgi:hypothetical protein
VCASFYTQFNPLNGAKEYVKHISNEGVRQRGIEKVVRTRQYGYSDCSWWSYALKCRFLAEGYRLPEKSEYELNVWMPFVLDAPGIEKPDNNRWLPQLECFPSPVWAGGSGEEGARK